MTKDQIFDMMCLTLGGRAAERILFGHLSTGASDDLRKVTEMAYSIVTQYGMSETVGNVSFPQSDGGFTVEKPYSEKTARLIDEEVKKLVNMAYQRTEELLRSHKDQLIAVANVLLDKEKLSAEDLIGILGERPYAMDAFQEYLKVALESQEEKYNAMKEKEVADAAVPEVPAAPETATQTEEKKPVDEEKRE